MLENTKINIKFKLAALWLTIFLLFIYGDLFSMWIPERLTDLLNGNMASGATTSTKLVGVSIFITIYAIMPLMNLILVPKISKILNIIISILFIAVWLLILTSFSPIWNFYIYLAIAEIVLALIIIYVAWNWPKKEIN